MNKITKYLTDDSQICYQDGIKITGANDVSESIIEYCESYNAGYKEAFKREVVKGIGIGLVVTFGVISVVTIVRQHKRNLKEEKDRA